MQNDRLFAKVVPEDQSFDDDYAGLLAIRYSWKSI